MWVVMAIRLLWLREGREIFLPQAITLQGKRTYRVSRAVASMIKTRQLPRLDFGLFFEAQLTEKA